MPPQRPLLIVHERLGQWARQLRPRVPAWGAAMVETRSAADLVEAGARSACPVVLADLADRPRVVLEDLDRLFQINDAALLLVLDPSAHPGLRLLALELGATHVLGGIVPPPRVIDLIARWLELSRSRAEGQGWVAEPAAPRSPRDALLAGLGLDLSALGLA